MVAEAVQVVAVTDPEAVTAIAKNAPGPVQNPKNPDVTDQSQRNANDPGTATATVNGNDPVLSPGVDLNPGIRVVVGIGAPIHAHHTDEPDLQN